MGELIVYRMKCRHSSRLLLAPPLFLPNINLSILRLEWVSPIELRASEGKRRVGRNGSKRSNPLLYSITSRVGPLESGYHFIPIFTLYSLLILVEWTGLIYFFRAVCLCFLGLTSYLSKRIRTRFPFSSNPSFTKSNSKSDS